MQNKVSFTLLLPIFVFFLFSLQDLLQKVMFKQDGINPNHVLLIMRFTTSFLFLLFLIRKKIEKHPIFADTSAQGLLLLILRTFFATMAVYVAFLSLQKIELIDMYSIYLTTPLFVALFASIFLREYLSRNHWLLILLAFAGCLVTMEIFKFNLFFKYSYNIFIPIVGVIFLAILNILTRKIKQYDVYTIAFLSEGSIFLLSLFLNQSFHNFLYSIYIFAHNHPVFFAISILSGVCNFLATLFFIKAIKVFNPAFVEAFFYTQIFWGTIFGYLFLKESVAYINILGLIMILGATLMLVKTNKAT